MSPVYYTGRYRQALGPLGSWSTLVNNRAGSHNETTGLISRGLFWRCRRAMPNRLDPGRCLSSPGSATPVCVWLVSMCVFIWDYPRRSQASSRPARRRSLQMIRGQFGRCLRVGQLSVTICPQPPTCQPPPPGPAGTGELNGSCVRVCGY